MYSVYKLNKQDDNIQLWCTPSPIWKQSIVPCLVLTIASYRFLMRQVRWSGIPISWRIFQFAEIHTVKGFGIVNKAEVDVFLEFFCFSMIQWMLAIWSLVCLPFLNKAWTSGSSQFRYSWNLAWRILSITLLACVKWVQLCGSLNILWHFLSLWLEWKLTFSSPVGHCWVF